MAGRLPARYVCRFGSATRRNSHPRRITRGSMEKQTDLTIMCETEPSDQPAERGRPAPRTESSATVLGLIEQVALDPRADVTKLERITALYERLTVKEAELAYNAAKRRI